MSRQKRMAIVSLYAVMLTGLFLYTALVGSPFKGISLSGAREPRLEHGESTADGFGVSASHYLAVDVGMEILRQGGSAVDAAVAVGYALGVVEPYGSGLGGGGVAVVYPADSREPAVFDYREQAPLSGMVTPSYAGVPGFVRGMEQLHDAFGSLPMEVLIEPAVSLAEDGFAIDPYLAERLQTNRNRLPVWRLPHFYPGGQPLKNGERLIQQELAGTLRTLQESGADEFYRGELARTMASRIGGLELNDFAAYRSKQTAPVTGSFKGYEVISAPAPYSGVTLLQILQLAELAGADQAGARVDYIQLLTEIFELTYRERARHIGDPGFVTVDEASLVDDRQMQALLAELFEGGLPGVVFPDPTLEQDTHGNTTHYTIVDSAGTMVSVTNSISQFFGSAIYVDGFFINNQLRNFAESDRSLNRIEPGKRPRSFAAPVIIAEDGRPFIGLGTPGGNWIPMVLGQVIIDFFAQGDLQAAVDLPRFYAYDDKVIYVEAELSAAETEALRERGYPVFLLGSPIATAVQGMVVDHTQNRIYGVTETHRAGTWRVEQITW